MDKEKRFDLDFLRTLGFLIFRRYLWDRRVMLSQKGGPG